MTAPQRELPDMVESADDGDRPSITGINGSVARFEMAYSPDKADRFRFGPPIFQRIPSLVFLAASLVLLALVLTAYAGKGSNWMYDYVVEGDKNRPFPAFVLSIVIVLSAAGTVLRAGMRGVVLTAEGIEARYLLAMGVPKIRKWGWAQIDRLVIDEEANGVMLELWNGEYERLPRVAEGKKMADLVAGIATARGRAVTRLTAATKAADAKDGATAA